MNRESPGFSRGEHVNAPRAAKKKGHTMSEPIPLKLGWSNPNCGPESMRLYALDQGDQPRWAEPHARVAETVLRELGAHEGSRWLLIPMPEATP